MRTKQFLGLRPGDTGAEFSLAGHLVELQQLVEAPQIQRHRCRELAADRIEPADHAGAATERDDGDAVLRAVPQDRGDLVVGAGQQHRVGSILKTGVLAPQQIQGGLAARTQQSVLIVDAAVARPDNGGQCLAVGCRQRRRAQLHLIGFEFGLG